MDKTRLETFSDAVIAIIMTILVLELSTPQTADLNTLFQMKEQFLAYGISFFILAIYWVNHHELFQLTDKINGQILWVNMLNLFLLSLFPFVTSWLGKNEFNSMIPAMIYGLLFLTTSLASAFLQYSLIKYKRKDSKAPHKLKVDNRILISPIMSIVAIFLALISPVLTPIICFLIAFIWIIPTKTFKNSYNRLNGLFMN